MCHGDVTMLQVHVILCFRIVIYIKILDKQNWLEFLFVVNATALKQQMSKKFVHKF